jgi:hypothetical protein
MPSFFEMVAKVLDRAYDELDDPKKDDLIAKGLDDLSSHYANVLTNGGPSYVSDVVRFGYVFRYATAHADYLNQAMAFSPDLRRGLDCTHVNITCIGGGPGSDVLGFVKYLLKQESRPKVTYWVLDKEQSWVDTWGDLDAIASDEIMTSRNFLAVDVTNKGSYEGYKKPFQADIFTLLYFLSEIFRFKEAATQFLDYCLSKMKKGALLVALDFEDTRLQEWIDGLAQKCGLETVESAEMRLVVGFDEQKANLQKYIDKFGSPKLQAQIMFRVYKKS